MRVSAETRDRTRKRIVDTASALFLDRGFSGTSTREIASRSGIAAGTLFNYFPSKEDLALSLVAEASERAIGRFLSGRPAEATLEQDLASLVRHGLDELRPLRPWLAEALHSGLSPFAPRGRCAGAERIRNAHLDAVDTCVRERFWAVAPEGLAAEGREIYWTLHLGVLATWLADGSEGEQETGAVLDLSIRLFTASLAEE